MIHKGTDGVHPTEKETIEKVLVTKKKLEARHSDIWVSAGLLIQELQWLRSSWVFPWSLSTQFLRSSHLLLAVCSFCIKWTSTRSREIVFCMSSSRTFSKHTGHARSQITRKNIVLGNEEQIKEGGVPGANLWALIRRERLGMSTA